MSWYNREQSLEAVGMEAVIILSNLDREGLIDMVIYV